MAAVVRFVWLAAIVMAVVLQTYKVEGQDGRSVPRLIADPAIRQLLEAVRRSEPDTIRDQIRLCEIPAPPFGEAARGLAYAAAMREAGLANVRVDAEGNVLGESPGRSSRPHLVLSAHLDTVFPPETPVRVTREGTRLMGPGIGDDCRGLAVVLAVARALKKSGIETIGPITFVGTVGEEGLGNLRGVTALMSRTLKRQVDGFVSVDGEGYAITNVGVGSRRFRVTYRGPGGHSYDDFGRASPINAIGLAVAAISRITPPARPKTTISVGRIGGGTSVNAIAAEAWMEVDLRSSAKDALGQLESRFRSAVHDGLDAENRRRTGHDGLTVAIEMIGNRPAGLTDANAPIVRTALDVLKGLGLSGRLEESSTDANYAMSVGIPAITVGGGGRGRDAHSVNEWFDPTDSWRGTQMVTVLALALTR